MQTSINKYQQTCVNYTEKILFNYNNQFLNYSYKKIQLHVETAIKLMLKESQLNYNYIKMKK